MCSRLRSQITAPRRVRNLARRIMCRVTVLLGLVVPLGGPAQSQPTADPVRLLVMNDPFADHMQRQRPRLEAMLGRRIDMQVTGYDALRRLLSINALRPASAYDIVAIDMAWLGEFGRAGLLTSLDSLAHDAPFLARFAQHALHGSSFDGRLLALPIQPHPELLFYRRDLLDRAGLTVPRTIEALLVAARHLHGSEPGLSGLCWNAARGSPLGQTVLHLAAAQDRDIFGPGGMPNFRSPGWRKAIDTTRAYLAVSPPLILDMAWDGRIRHFASGGCAFTYGWGARAAFVEAENTVTRGRVGYAAAPHAEGALPVTPFGAWLLGIPANLPPSRRVAALNALMDLTGPSGVGILLESGLSATALSTVYTDPAVQARHPILATVAELARRGELADWMRPAVPEFQHLSDILGNEVHAVLTGTVETDVALARIQARADALFATRRAR